MHEPLRFGLVRVVASDHIDAFSEALCGAVGNSSAALTRFWSFDHNRVLVLKASAGKPIGGGSYTQINGAFSRIEVGSGKIGRIAATGQPLLAPCLRGDEEWLANPGWVARQGIRSFAGLALIADGEVVGVVAVFGRVVWSDGFLADLALAADIAAARLRGLLQRGESASETAPAEDRILTRAGLRALERQSLEAALARTNGKVFGADGAAALVAMKPTTLLSRVKALGVRMPCAR